MYDYILQTYTAIHKQPLIKRLKLSLTEKLASFTKSKLASCAEGFSAFLTSFRFREP